MSSSDHEAALDKELFEDQSMPKDPTPPEIDEAELDNDIMEDQENEPDQSQQEQE